MDIFRKIIFISSLIIVLIANGIVCYLFLNTLNTARIERVGQLRSEYLKTGRNSDLLQIGILNPQKVELAKISHLLLEKGDYQTANVIGMISDVPNYNLIAGESALFNQNYEMAEEYLIKVPPSKDKDELVVFGEWLKSGKLPSVNQSVYTDAGKLMNMVLTGDMNLYLINNQVGRQITEINKQYPEPLGNILANSDLLSENKLYYPALSLLDSKNFDCNTDYYLLKSSIYSDLNKPIESLEQIKIGLACDPVNTKLLQNAVIYSKSQGLDSDVTHYQNRLNQLNIINK